MSWSEPSCKEVGYRCGYRCGLQVWFIDVVTGEDELERAELQGSARRHVSTSPRCCVECELGRTWMAESLYISLAASSQL